MEKKITRPELKWVLKHALIVVLVTSIPYLLGAAAQGRDWVFSGFFFGVEDGNSYIAKMLRGTYGEWLFRTPFTAYPQEGVLAFFPYYLLGKLAAPPSLHIQLVGLFQLFKILGVGLVFYASYRFSAFFLPGLQSRRLSMLIITLGGGLGWLFPLGLDGLWQGRIPLEFYSPESFGFLAVLGLPHLAAARALLLLGVLNYLKFPGKIEKKHLITGSAIWFGLALMQPLTVMTGWLMVFLHVGYCLLSSPTSERSIQLKKSLGAVLPVFGAAPIVLYTFIKFSVDPFLLEWTRQNIIASPPLTDYLLAWGSVIPFAVAGAWRLLRSKNMQGALLAIWLVFGFILAYAPYNLQRRLPEGIWPAMVVLALVCIEKMKPGLLRISRVWLSLGMLASLFFLIGGIAAATNPKMPLFRTQAEVNAFKFLSEKCSFDDVVLASYNRSNALPAWAPVRTVIGHGPESIHLEETNALVSVFFNDPKLEIELLAKFDIKFILLGPEQAHLLPATLIDTSYQFDELFNENEFRVVRVTKR